MGSAPLRSPWAPPAPSAGQARDVAAALRAEGIDPCRLPPARRRPPWPPLLAALVARLRRR